MDLVDVKACIIQCKSIRKSTYPDLYAAIVSYTTFLAPTAKIKERIYCIMNDITLQPLCKQCETNMVRFLGPSSGYREFCSNVCSSNNTDKQRKIRITNLDKFGTNTPAEADSVKQRTKDTLAQKYGNGITSTQQLGHVKDKTKATNLAKYGTDTFINSETFKTSTNHTVYNKYKCNHINQRHIDPKSLTLLNDEIWLKYQNHSLNKTLLTISQELGVSVATVSVWFQRHGITPSYYTAISQAENELLLFIKSTGIDVVSQDRSTITPQELDIVIHSKKLAIEYCGLYWHSDIHTRITNNYHYNKMVMCNNVGYQLITVFEDEWLHNREVVKHRLLHLLGKTRGRIYARQCEVVNISPKQKSVFFNKYHIQGNGGGSINIGLTKNGELVACMTFISRKNGIYELNRYATSSNVVGGFSRLLSHFEKSHTWSSIISFADLRWSKGDIYYSNRFNMVNQSVPSYDYVIGTHRYHRRNFMKHLLPKKLALFDENLTEFENCDNNSILRIWNCGQLKFIKNNEPVVL